MEYVYHGSSTRGLKELTPHKSTHGNYLYATDDKRIAIVFSKRCGDDLVYSFGKNDDGPYHLVERMPGVLEKMFSNDSSIYTLPADNFKDLKTGFKEVLSTESAPVLNEEYIPNVFDAVKKLEEEGFLRIYRYPSRPEWIPEDDSDLVQKIVRHSARTNEPLTKNTFNRLVFLHPDLMDKVNDCLIASGVDDLFSEDDISRLMEMYRMRSIENPKGEYYISNALELMKIKCPEYLKLFGDENKQL